MITIERPVLRQAKAFVLDALRARHCFDAVITHSPPTGCLDGVKNDHHIIPERLQEESVHLPLAFVSYVPKLDVMKYLMTLFALIVSTAAVAQYGYQTAQAFWRFQQ